MLDELAGVTDGGGGRGAMATLGRGSAMKPRGKPLFGSIVMPDQVQSVRHCYPIQKEKLRVARFWRTANVLSVDLRRGQQQFPRQGGVHGDVGA
jgi:hypothetical protein